MGTIAALKEIIVGLLALIKDAKELIALVKREREEAWIQRNRELAKRIEGAKTDEDRKKLVRELSEHHTRTP